MSKSKDKKPVKMSIKEKRRVKKEKQKAKKIDI